MRMTLPKSKSNKLVLGFAALVAAATIGATGIAAAQTSSAQMLSLIHI